jgi:hypothetical protein
MLYTRMKLPWAWAMATLRLYDFDNGVLAVDLRHLLDLLAPRSLEATWTISPVRLFYPNLARFEEDFEATGPGGDKLELLMRARSRVSGIILAEEAHATRQVIWAEFTAILPEQEGIWVTIRAIDSTFYEVTTDDDGVLNKIKSTYKDVRVAAGPAGLAPIPQLPRERQ